jgi:D-lactate dehydrogenase
VGRSPFTRDPDEQAALWRVRKGIIPSVGAMRARGTSCIIEDVVFPLEHLAEGVSRLQELFALHGYDDAIVFGHAKDGNLHFVLNQAFREPADIERYDAFMVALAELVAVRHGGALKAEHGTGRNMAPFVATEWGGAAHRVMLDLKRLIDPDGLLNPGVILNADPRAHVRNLKSLPTVEPEIDQCIECGFCERMCPSRDLTLTPRQRIVVRREMARLRARTPEASELAALRSDFVYDGLDTCATDGLCATACPVGIDTGLLVKRLRRESHSPTRQEFVRLVARHFSVAERLARLALAAGRLVRRDLPPPARTGLPVTPRTGASGVYFPSCVSRVVGPHDAAEPPLSALLVEVSGRAGLPLWIPPDTPGHCCGLPFSSKGFDRAASLAVNRTVEALWRWSDGGDLPVVVDSSPCVDALGRARETLSAPNRDRLERLRLMDSIEFAHDEVLPRRPPERLGGRVALHPVCSVQRMNLTGKLLRLAQACAETAEIPFSAGCCGFAGDRGFTRPELTRAATRLEAREVAGGGYDGFYSSSRTCEIGLARATGETYRHVWALLELATRGSRRSVRIEDESGRQDTPPGPSTRC